MNAKVVYQYTRCSLSGHTLSITNLYEFISLNGDAFKCECFVDSVIAECKVLTLDILSEKTTNVKAFDVSSCKLG